MLLVVQFYPLEFTVTRTESLFFQSKRNDVPPLPMVRTYQLGSSAAYSAHRY